MIYHAHDLYIGRSLDLYGEWEQEGIELTQQYARGIVIDVGAHVGTHTLPYARTADVVIAIEPQYPVLQMLIGNLALNCIENVRPYAGACGATNGKIALPTIDYSQSWNFGGISLGEGNTEVGMISIDSLNVDPDFIKIDAEGMEIDVLLGACETVKRARPVLYVESDRADKRTALCTLVESLGYTVHWHIPPLYNPENFFQNRENVFPEIYSKNMLCLPK
jgi:FkbM family methyltransferase